MENVLAFLELRSKSLESEAKELQSQIDDSGCRDVEEEADFQSRIARTEIIRSELSYLNDAIRQIDSLNDAVLVALRGFHFSEEELLSESDFEDIIPALNAVLKAGGYLGEIIVVWDEYKGGFLSGGSQLHYLERIAELQSAAQVYLPTPEDAKEFATDLVLIRDGLKPMKPTHLCQVPDYQYQFARQVRGDGVEELEPEDDDDSDDDEDLS